MTSLHTTFTLRPRHDLFQVVYHFARGIIELDYTVYDRVELEFTFREPSGKESPVPDCVWAIVAKDEMKRLRNDRWDMVRRKFRARSGEVVLIARTDLHQDHGESSASQIACRHVW